MKRCPECEFLYFDQQDRCDIDGTRLRFTTKLPTLPAEAGQKKSLRGTLTIALLATIILGIVLFIFYPPKLHSSTPSPAAEVKRAKVLDANTNSHLPLSLDANTDSHLSSSEASQPRTSTPSPKSAVGVRDPFARMETRTEKSVRASAATKPNVTISGPANRSIEAKPSMNQVTTVNQASPMSQKPSTPSNSISGPSARPVAAATATPKPVTQNSNKDSKFNSMLKKAGRILKKPF